MKSPRMTLSDERYGNGTGNVRGNVLFMDDEESIRDSVSQILKILGYQVALAKEGGEAVELYRTANERGEPFDVVLMDLQIKGGMGGEQTIRELLDFDPNVRAVIASGSLDSQVMINFRKYGFQEALGKPFTMEQLGEIIGTATKSIRVLPREAQKAG